ncbi:MAG: chemotaxis protein CheW, partial [Myxococcaceae bacterium]
AIVSQVTPDSAPVPTETPPAVEAPASKAAPTPAPLGLPPRFALKLRIAPSCPVPGVRAFLVYKKLSSLGNVFDLRPALEELKAGRIPGGNFALELETGAGETAISQALKSISEVEIVGVSAVVATQAPPAPPPPAPNPAAPIEASKVVGATEQARTVKVRTELLDYFLDTVGELLIATARIREVGKSLPEASRPLLEEGVDRLHSLVKDLHDKVMTVRMTPIQIITDRLPRVARDIARKRGREVDLVITGAEIELDRAILDELADPLLHLLRNCIDHGLESPDDRTAAGKKASGRLLINVRRDRDRVVVDMEDDGRGMDAEKLKAAAVARGLITADAAARMNEREAFMLSCLPGVSTARDVSDISGRGVGMDAVKRAVENVGGTLEIESEKGKGTRFTLRLPLTVAVVNLLLVQVGEEAVGLPIGKVLGAVEADPAELSESRSQKLLSHGNSLVPVYGLSELLQLPSPPRIGLRPYVLMEGESGRVALEVDRLLGQEEVVLKALSRPLDLIPGLSGVTILGSGRPVFILDVPRLLAA